jgi:arylsulfatase A-like enzyme
MLVDNCNIIVIVSDTFRRDHIGFYGNPDIYTPHLDKLAAQSVVFDNCHAGSFPTVPARYDLLTGRHSFVLTGWGPLPIGEITLPHRLAREKSYVTMGIADTPFYLRNGYGYDRGFEDFIWVRGQRRGTERRDAMSYWTGEESRFAAQTLGQAEKWIEKNYKEKFFLLCDTWDPHEPWCAPDHYIERYLPDYDGTPPPWPCYWDYEEAGMPKSEVDRAHAHYCAEVTLVDHWVGRLMERLESLDLMKKTVIVFTADHGFYFGEHGMFGKANMRSEDAGYVVGLSATADTARDSLTLIFRDPKTGKVGPGSAKWWRSPIYEEVSGIPLIMHLPGYEPKRINSLVTLPSIMPTLLDLLNLDAGEPIQAPSLKPLLDGEAEEVNDFVVTSWPLYNPGESIRVVDDWERIVEQPMPSTIRTREWAFFYAMEGEPVELYHLPTDSGLTNNVAEQNPDVCRDLHARFVAFLESHGTNEAFLKRRRRL